ncbi:MAG: NUDIX domain-containing protein [Acidimicrobiia bacterium]|nr:NUDIX domain-containing protein [Acidimicrobiia bacterium]
MDQQYRLTANGADFVSLGDRLEMAIAMVESALIPAAQEPARRSVLDFCRSRPDALHRSCLDGHLTASAFVVDVTSQAVALIHHRKLGLWLQPGGHADGEANLLRVSASEVAEEVGLTDLRFALPAFDVDIHSIPARGEDPPHYHHDLRFLAVTSGTPDLSGNHETRGADWVGLSDPRMHHGDAVADAARRAVELADALRSGS